MVLLLHRETRDDGTSPVLEVIIAKQRNGPLKDIPLAIIAEQMRYENFAVGTPFMGVGSEVYMSVLMGRKGIGIELKGTYYQQAIKNIKRALYERENPTGEGLLNFETASADGGEEADADYGEAL